MTRPEDDADKAKRLGKPIARFMARWRSAIRKRPWLNVLYRALITVLGALIVVIGLILVPLPGPGWLIVFIGLTVLGSEYHWARRILGWLRRALARFWERWNAWRARRASRRSGHEPVSQEKTPARGDGRAVAAIDVEREVSEPLSAGEAAPRRGEDPERLAG